jgi:nucleoside-diphosphate-sugar epimerase
VKGTLNVLRAAIENGNTAVLQTSTSEVYGTAQFVPINESHPLNAQSPYAASKIASDQLALSFHRSFGLPVTVVRPFNTYGPRQSARAVIAAIIGQALSGERSIKLGATHPTRDFTYVKDTASAFVALAASEASIGQVTNVGSNFEITIGDVVGVIAKAMGVTLDIETDEKRLRPEASEVERLWADNTKMLSSTVWRPAYGGYDGFSRGIGETIDWFRDARARHAGHPRQYII